MFSRNQLSDFFFQTPLYFSVTELMNKLAHEKCLVDMDVFFAQMKLQNLQKPTVVEGQMWVFHLPFFYWYAAGKFWHKMRLRSDRNSWFSFFSQPVVDHAAPTSGCDRQS